MKYNNKNKGYMTTRRKRFVNNIKSNQINYNDNTTRSPEAFRVEENYKLNSNVNYSRNKKNLDEKNYKNDYAEESINYHKPKGNQRNINYNNIAVANRETSSKKNRNYNGENIIDNKKRRIEAHSNKYIYTNNNRENNFYYY